MEEIKEEWRSIEGFPGYQVSNLGRVKSSYLKGPWDRSTAIDNEWHLVKPKLGTNGYLYVVLCRGSNKTNKSIHRLVAEAFIPNPENKGDVNHIDENKLNNVVTNLNWMTRKENINWGTGHERSTEKHRGLVWSAESRRRCSEAHKGLHHTEESKRKISLAGRNNPLKSRPVIQYDENGCPIATYPSMNEASRQTGIPEGTIWNCCNTSTTPRSRRWSYLQSNFADHSSYKPSLAVG